MKIVSDFAGDYKDGYISSLNIEEFSDDTGEDVFFYGIQCGIDKSYLETHKDYTRKILLDLWSPCAFFVPPNHFTILEGFDEVYSICPFTCEWTNAKLGKKLMKYWCYPVTPRILEPPGQKPLLKRLADSVSRCFSGSTLEATDYDFSQKLYDVCYVGGIYSPEHQATIDIISKFNYIFITQSSAQKATHRFLSNAEKIRFVGKSRIGICFNKLYPMAEHLRNISTYDDWQSNGAFSHVSEPVPIVPQFKTRVHELAMCRTLILCHRDPWNLIEDFYEPGKDFIYFDNVHDLNKLIPDILADWDSYKSITDNAYKKVSNYFTENLVKMVQDGNEFSRQITK